MPNPMLKSNGTIDIIKSDGPRFPLGMMKNAAYTENRLNSKKDDVLVLITDGITKALSRKNSSEKTGLKIYSKDLTQAK
jgi:serine phosphatase RsbU (regulator of sigma subunit)